MAKYQTYKLSDGEKAQLKGLFNDEELKSIPKEVIRILFNRGIRTKEEINYNLFGKINNLYDVPMRDSQEFCNRLTFAHTKGEEIVVMGDYDTDGCMATCVMVLGLSKLGFNVKYYMNSRFKDGYGLKTNSVDEIIKRHPNVKVIITVDNGVKAFEAIDYCNSKGIDVLVTDHHVPGNLLPNAVAVIDPKRSDCMYPFKELCGAGVAWKLMLRLCDFLYPDSFFRKASIKNLDWLVAIATVGDQVPLVGENRIIVKHVLDKLNSKDSTISPFMYMIRDYLKIERFDSDTIGFYISPMINAMGRIEGNPLQVVDAIVSNDKDMMEAIINRMDVINKNRREMTEEQLQEALRLLEQDNPSDKGILVYSGKFTEGIIGIVAGRLVDRFRKPVIVLCPNEDGDYKGSCRSIEGIDIESVLNGFSEYLVNFGGHPMAAGLTIKAENVEKFKSKFIGLCNFYKDELFEDVVNIDLPISENDVNLSLCTLVEYLGPYGNSFRKPRFMIQNFNIDVVKSKQNKCNDFYVGSEGKTLRLVCQNGLVAIGFKSAEKFKSIGEPSLVHLVGYPSINNFNGKQYPQFVIEKDYVIKTTKK